jgi:hypothetical protein
MAIILTAILQVFEVLEEQDLQMVRLMRQKPFMIKFLINYHFLYPSFNILSCNK